MRCTDSSPPQIQADFHTWAIRHEELRVLFVGKGPHGDRARALHDLTGEADLELAWPRQIHSSKVIEARGRGLCGEADALITPRHTSVVSVATADCVPIVVCGSQAVAAVHAGWRGLAQNIVERTLERFADEPQQPRAWIGPAIGPCCYEVDEEVAQRVADAADATVITERRPKPHLDLVAAARLQLERGGVEPVWASSLCTRCSVDWLWSYRRDGRGAGRNWVFAWREGGPPEPSEPAVGQP